MPNTLSSFGRSFLVLHSVRNASSKRINATLNAAKKRWPNGHVERSKHTIRYLVPGQRGEFCGILVDLRPLYKGA